MTASNPSSNPPLKICLCVANFKSDLIEATSSTTAKLANQLAETNDCTLLVPGELPAQADPNGKLKWISYAQADEYASKVRVFKNIKALGRHFRESTEKYDLVHFQLGNLLEMFLIWLLLPKIDAPRIVTVWQPYVGLIDSIKMPWVFRRNLKGVVHHYLFNTWMHLPFFIIGQSYFSKIIVQTLRQKRQLPFIGKNRIEVIINGVEGGGDDTDEPQGNEGPAKILYIGHPTAVKGIDVLLAALAQIKNQTDFHATLALSTFKNIDPEALVREHGLEDRVTIKGKIDVYAEMRDHDMLLCPYKASVGTSWYPNIVLEAFSVGLPIIASNVPELREIVEEGVTGKLVPPNDAHALANAILAVSGHPELANHMRANQRRHFQDRFTFGVYLQCHRDLYAKIAKGGMHREQSVKDFYSAKTHARDYNKIRFGNSGGRLIDDWEKSILLEMIDGHPKDKPIIEVAAGTGRFSLMLAHMGYRVIALDHSMEMLLQIQAAAQEEGLDITCIRGDAFQMPFADDTFPTVFSMRFVWHYKAMHAAISELARIARDHVVIDLINRFSLGMLTMSVANHLVRRELYTELTSRGKIEKFFKHAALVPVLHRSAFFFPYIAYRKLSPLAFLLGPVDRFLVRVSPFGSLLYYKLEKTRDRSVS
jgi:glycosyltransferase involved in cell wall biosynthesis/ubiquinone/menaquinone biosynthesis C-methylase UbiE